jgi:hypothetical protein
MNVAMDVMRGPLKALWSKGFVRPNAVTMGQLELHLMNKGWHVINEICNGADFKQKPTPGLHRQPFDTLLYCKRAELFRATGRYLCAEIGDGEMP